MLCDAHSYSLLGFDASVSESALVVHRANHDA
jgi:hypothetical protein